MTIHYEIRQQVKTVNKIWLETIFSTQCERVARASYEDLVKDNPLEYFELLKIENTEECLAFTPLKGIV